MTSESTMQVANAPCSYGAFENTVDVYPNVPAPIGLLDDVQDAGYVGIDLGPLGYLGDISGLPNRLHDRGLSLAGGYFAIEFNSDGDIFSAERERFDQLLDIFDAAAVSGAPLPRPTLADAGSATRAAQPGRAQTDRSLGWDERGWARFAQALARFVDHSRGRGFEPTFHPHTATFVEAPWEIDRVLECSDVGLCLDTGHLLLAGGDPVAAARDWGGRLNHVHLKDADLAVVRQIVEDRAPVEEIWRRRAFCRLGAGDVALDEVIDALRANDYAGWLVVEQDIFPDSDTAVPDAIRDQILNREFLSERGI